MVEDTNFTYIAKPSRIESLDLKIQESEQGANYRHPGSLRPVTPEEMNMLGNGEAEIQSCPDMESEVHYKQVTSVRPVVKL